MVHQDRQRPGTHLNFQSMIVSTLNCPIFTKLHNPVVNRSYEITDDEFLMDHGIDPTDAELEDFMARVDALVSGGKVSLTTARRVAFDEYMRKRGKQ